MERRSTRTKNTRSSRGANATRGSSSSVRAPVQRSYSEKERVEMSNKSVVQGKVVIDTDLQGMYIIDLLNFQNWRELMHIDLPIYEWQVKQFYHNLKVIDKKVVSSLVDGIEIKFTSEELGSILDIPHTGYMCYNTKNLIMDEDDDAETLNILLVGGEGLGGDRRPKRTILDPEAKILLNIVENNIVPNKVQDGRLLYSEMNVMFCMYKNKLINLPAVMCNHMHYIVKKGNKNLAYGSYLTKVFRHFNVPLDHTITSELKRPIRLDMLSINRQGVYWYGGRWFGRDEFKELPEVTQKVIIRRAKKNTTFTEDEEDLGGDQEDIGGDQEDVGVNVDHMDIETDVDTGVDTGVGGGDNVDVEEMVRMYNDVEVPLVDVNVGVESYGAGPSTTFDWPPQQPTQPDHPQQSMPSVDPYSGAPVWFNAFRDEVTHRLDTMNNEVTHRLDTLDARMTMLQEDVRGGAQRVNEELRGACQGMQTFQNNIRGFTNHMSEEFRASQQPIVSGMASIIQEMTHLRLQHEEMLQHPNPYAAQYPDPYGQRGGRRGRR